MKRKDIQVGHLYAYQRGRGEYASPSPCVLLSDEVHARTYLHSGPSVIKPAPGQKPRQGGAIRGTGYGYPIAMVDYGTADAPEKLTGITTIAQAKTADGVRIEVIPLVHLAGPWAEVKAAYDDHQKRRKEHRDRESQAQMRLAANTRDVVDRIVAAGLPEPKWNATRGELTLTTEQARAWLDRIGPRNGAAGPYV